ncbi:MAG: histidine phosphatase family protein [Lachnospiraceae bacterium]
MKVLLVRHGETDWNVASRIQGMTDTDLNEKGIEQARELGRSLITYPGNICRIYTSPLKRARQTADILSEYIGVSCEVLEGIEEMNFGIFEGISWKEAKVKHEDAYAKWHRNRRYTKIPEGESYQDVYERVSAAIEKITENETGEVLVITHSGVIKTLLSGIYNTPFQEMATRYVTENCKIVPLEV